MQEEGLNMIYIDRRSLAAYNGWSIDDVKTALCGTDAASCCESSEIEGDSASVSTPTSTPESNENIGANSTQASDNRCGLQRRGHIYGAVPFPISWWRSVQEVVARNPSVQPAELVQKILVSELQKDYKALTTEKFLSTRIHVYDDGAASEEGLSARQLSDLLREAGCSDVTFGPISPQHFPLTEPVVHFCPRWNQVVPLCVAALFTKSRSASESLESSKCPPRLSSTPDYRLGGFSQQEVARLRYIFVSYEGIDAVVQPSRLRDHSMVAIRGWELLMTEEIERPEDKYRLRAGDSGFFADFLSRWGFTSLHDPILIYSDDPMASARTAFIFTYIGMTNVRLCDGEGELPDVLPNYQSHRRRTQKQVVSSLQPEFRDSMIVSLEDVKSKVFHGSHQAATLVDVRSEAEHRGEVTGYSYHDKKGTIPGSVLACAGLHGSNSLDYYRIASIPSYLRDHYSYELSDMHLTQFPPASLGFRPCHSTDLHWERQGLSRLGAAFLPAVCQEDAATTAIQGEKAIDEYWLYCGSGWRAAEVFYACYLMGQSPPKIRLFSDGWIAWSNDLQEEEEEVQNSIQKAKAEN